MWQTQSPSLPADEALRHLQELLLKAVILNQPLPGCNQPIMYPDLPLLQQQTAVIVSEENLAGPLSISDLQSPIRILAPEVLLQEARAYGDIIYWHFQPPERRDKLIRLTLQAKIAPHDPNQNILGLSGIQVKFQEVAGRWETIDEPVVFAS